MDQRLQQIYSKFISREDNAMWDLELREVGENQISIRLETNDAYLRGRPVMRVVLDKTISITEEDHIDELPQLR